MRNTALKFVAGVFALSMVFAAPAAAAPSWPHGEISCAITGSLSLKPPLTDTPSSKAIKVKGLFTPVSPYCPEHPRPAGNTRSPKGA